NYTGVNVEFEITVDSYEYSVIESLIKKADIDTDDFKKMQTCFSNLRKKVETGFKMVDLT
ncbi:hypothetical protein LCGC14_2861100, partial [marine sediment metagenome]